MRSGDLLVYLLWGCPPHAKVVFLILFCSNSVREKESVRWSVSLKRVKNRAYFTCNKSGVGGSEMILTTIETAQKTAITIYIQQTDRCSDRTHQKTSVYQFLLTII